MEFKGLNKRVDDAEIADGESPDTSNTYFPNNKWQALGPRKGKRFFNSTAYASAVRGIIPFRIPGMTPEMVLGLNDGSLRPVDAPFTVQSPNAAFNFHRVVMQDQLTPSLVYPASSAATGNVGASGNPNFAFPEPVYLKSGDIILLKRPTISVSGWGESSGAGTVDLTLYFTVITQDFTVQESAVATFALSRENLGGTAGQAAGTPTTPPGDYGQGFVLWTSSIAGGFNLFSARLAGSYANISGGTFEVTIPSEFIVLNAVVNA